MHHLYVSIISQKFLKIFFNKSIYRIQYKSFNIALSFLEIIVREQKKLTNNALVFIKMNNKLLQHSLEHTGIFLTPPWIIQMPFFACIRDSKVTRSLEFLKELTVVLNIYISGDRLYEKKIESKANLTGVQKSHEICSWVSGKNWKTILLTTSKMMWVFGHIETIYSMVTHTKVEKKKYIKATLEQKKREWWILVNIKQRYTYIK